MGTKIIGTFIYLLHSLIFQEHRSFWCCCSGIHTNQSRLSLNEIESIDSFDALCWQIKGNLIILSQPLHSICSDTYQPICNNFCDELDLIHSSFFVFHLMLISYWYTTIFFMYLQRIYEKLHFRFPWLNDLKVMWSTTMNL